MAEKKLLAASFFLGPCKDRGKKAASEKKMSSDPPEKPINSRMVSGKNGNPRKGSRGRGKRQN